MIVLAGFYMSLPDTISHWLVMPLAEFYTETYYTGSSLVFYYTGKPTRSFATERVSLDSV
jgi:hypothetical protein